MKKIILIACASQKRSRKSKASDLYVSPLFIKSLAYAKRLNPDKIFILSAKYGLLDLNTEIEPYNLTLNTMSTKEIKDWSIKVIEQLKEISNLQEDKFIFLAGKNYRKYIEPELSYFEAPMENMRIGEQLHFLSVAKK